MIRRLPGLAAAALMVALLPASADARYSAKKAIWGPAYVNGVSQFPRYKDLGVGVYEDRIRWDAVAPTRPSHPRDPNDPAYRWPAETTQAVTEAGQNGIKVALMLIGAPGWANGGHTWQWAPKRERDYADFAYAASRRYPGVKLWMIWGEPSSRTNFRPLLPSRPGGPLTRAQAAAPRRYARLLEAAYQSLKQASRVNQVIGGMTYTTGSISTWQWVAYMRLPNGQPPHLDMYGHNPFSFRHPDFRLGPSCCDSADFSDLVRLGGAIDNNLRRGPRRRIPLFLSEFTLPTGPDREFNFWLDRETQAAWIRDVLKIVRRSTRIRALGWIHLQDEPPRPDGGPRIRGGLLNYRGEPKPGYAAFKDG